MFSLKSTELRPSWLSVALWLVIAATSAALLQRYWMPAFWRVSLFLCALMFVLVWCIRWRCQVGIVVGIDEMGAFVMNKGQCERLCFVRANGVQLIAKEDRKSHFREWLWPKYWVIYRDNIAQESYLILRSYAAQQILQRRNDKAKTL
ncbi:hypothetical protein [Marinomonas sp. IMCC 4694]|uniref:hypothetical protein n=1 Tax=Marinomonas sp. IMCC 4694 TaxID=2605432 RepID=UPI0016530D3D|nr:hypothetical protein [Marinomonas sp. IMCC 4694]